MMFFIYFIVEKELFTCSLSCFIAFRMLQCFFCLQDRGAQRFPYSWHWLLVMVIMWHLTLEHLIQFSSVQSLSRARLFATPWIAAHQASLSITNSRSLLKLMPIELVMPSNHLILCHPLFLLPPVPPSIRVFSNESTLHMGWPKYWSFSFSISPSNEHPGLISFRMDWLDLLAVQGTLKSLLQHTYNYDFVKRETG